MPSDNAITDDEGATFAAIVQHFETEHDERCIPLLIHSVSRIALIGAMGLWALPAMAQQAAARKQEAFTEQRIGNEPVLAMSSASATQTADHFVLRDGLQFAGTHLLIDLWGASRLDDLAHVEAMLTEAVGAVGATLLNIDLHHFQPEGGISGVAIFSSTFAPFLRSFGKISFSSSST